MRLTLAIAGGVAWFACAGEASAATIVIYADPMTMERRTVVVSPDGPDRAYFCVMPPSLAGCQQVPIRRSSR